MTRPPALLLAVVVLALEGVGGLAWAALLAALIGSFGDVDPITASTAVAAAVFGAAALVAAVGAWGRRTWSWPIGAVLQALVMLGVIVAGVSGGWHPALLAGVILGGLGMVALFNPETRRALGV
jgi:uncharacterized membrane protein YfcA